MTDNNPNPNPSGQPSTRQLVIGGAAALIVAVLILVFFVLPAEFGVDPAGTGEATGISNLSQAGEMTELERGEARMEQDPNVLTLSDEPMRSTRWEWTLRPYESVEYKFTLAEGEPLAFSWQASDTVNYDMHSHPFEGGEAMTESFGVAASDGMQGLYIAPFSGIHGWYFQNRQLEDVSVVVNAAGGYTETTLFDDTGEYPEPVAPVE